MRILIISDSPWRKDNSFGNTYSNRFSRIPEIEIAHIYTLAGEPEPDSNTVAFYQIPEGQVLRSVFKRKTSPAGYIVQPEESKTISTSSEISENRSSWYGKLVAFGKRHHWMSMFMAREAGWRLGNINWEGLLRFAKEFNPDLVFLPIFYTYYTNRIGLYLKQELGIPMVLEISMDYYTFKRFSLNPLFWIDRVFKRRMMRRLTKEASLMYVISEKLKAEYEKRFSLPIKVLYKVPDPTRYSSSYNRTHNGPIRFLYTGNLYANRWKSLSLLVNELVKTRIGQLDIYTATPINDRMNHSLNVEGVSRVHPPVSQTEVIRLQNEADILVHVESFDLANRLLVRYAISTKVMDYLNSKRCILAIGPSDVASIEYLRENDIALVASDSQSLSEIWGKIRSDENVIQYYADRSKNYVLSELDPDVINNGLLQDLRTVADIN